MRRIVARSTSTLLINALTILRDPETGAAQISMVEKGLSALEGLLFAKYQMYRNVYWHHAVRSATAMYKRLVADALDAGALDARTLAGFTDEGILHVLTERAPSPLIAALRQRRLYKRAFETPAADLAPDAAEWIADDRQLTVAVENALAKEVGLQPGELLLDYPEKTQMLGLDLLVQRPYGEVRRLTAAGWEGAINLPKLSEEFYRSARWLRVYTAPRVAIDPTATRCHPIGTCSGAHRALAFLTDREKPTASEVRDVHRFENRGSFFTASRAPGDAALPIAVVRATTPRPDGSSANAVIVSIFAYS